MKFKLDNSFDDNLALFKAEAEKIDQECAKILFDNLGLLEVGGDAPRNRTAISEFHNAILTALDDLQKKEASDKS